MEGSGENTLGSSVQTERALGLVELHLCVCGLVAALAFQESTPVACQTSSSSHAASAGRLEEVILYRKACRGPLLLPPLANNSRQGTGLGGVGRRGTNYMRSFPATRNELGRSTPATRNHDRDGGRR